MNFDHYNLASSKMENIGSWSLLFKLDYKIEFKDSNQILGRLW